MLGLFEAMLHATSVYGVLGGTKKGNYTICGNVSNPAMRLGGWISYYIHVKWDVIAHSHPNFYDMLVQVLLQLGHWWIITSHKKMWKYICHYIPMTLTQLKSIKYTYTMLHKILHTPIVWNHPINAIILPHCWWKQWQCQYKALILFKRPLATTWQTFMGFLVTSRMTTVSQGAI